MKKLVKMDVRDWWELMNGIVSWAILFEARAQQRDVATDKKAKRAMDVSRNLRRIVNEIESQIGETGYHPGLGEHLKLLL